MIRRQYDIHEKDSYFTKFINENKFYERVNIQQALIPWQATVAKGKRHHSYNIKFHNRNLYLQFVLRWS